jgi:hypothetical protein
VRNSAITSALINALLADAALMALTPDGVFFSVAGASMANGGSAKRFVIVALIVGVQVRMFEGRAFNEVLYLVEARILASSGTNAPAVAHDAAARIDAILDPQPPLPPATLTIPGFTLKALYQEEPTEDIEFDEADTAIQWIRNGGRYRLWAAPIAA